MFVGEMGCWLVVGASYLYRRYISSEDPAAEGYQAVNTNDSEDANTDGAVEVSGAAGKPVEEGSQGVLEGYRIVLLALPAICDICGTTLMNAGLLMVAASIY